MRKLVAPVAAIALLFAVGAASADETEGEITAYNQETHELTLNNGMKFNISESVSMEALQQGAKVKVTYNEQDGKMVATEVTASQAE